MMWSKVCRRLAPAASGCLFAAPFAPERSRISCEKDDRGGQVFPGYDSDGFTHDTASGFSLFLQERCQRIFFIRHAEGLHNLAERESTMEPKNQILMKENSGYVYWDPKLTKNGEEQCAKLKGTIRGSSVWGFDKPLGLDLVVVSPTTRTLQTAFLSLGTADTPGAPNFVSTELCREHISDAMCDGRRSITELKRDFPGVDFSLVESNEDEMFFRKETEEQVEERAQAFLKWLCGRPETHIAVVTHSIFLKTLLKQFADEVSEEDRNVIHDHWVNAEMRSIMLCAHRKFPSSVHGSVSSDLVWKQSEIKKSRASWNHHNAAIAQPSASSLSIDRLA